MLFFSERLGAINGTSIDPKHLKPETGLLQLRVGLKVFANLRPATILPQEYKSVSKLRMTLLRESFLNTCHFTVLFRGIPRSSEGNYSSSLEQFLAKYYPTTYISHEMVFRCGKMVKLMKKAETMYDLFLINNHSMHCASCKYCVGRQDSIQPEETNEKAEFIRDDQEPPLTGKVSKRHLFQVFVFSFRLVKYLMQKIRLVATSSNQPLFFFFFYSFLQLKK